MIFPIIHLNGTAPLVLAEQADNAVAALEAARKALVEMAPHGRDYPFPGRTYASALDQYLHWLARVENVLTDVTTYRDSLYDDAAIADAMSPYPTTTEERA